MYVSEMAPKERRGTLATLYQLFITLGILIAYISGYFINKYVKTDFQWRLMFFLAASPAIVVLFLALFFMQESTIWKRKKAININEEPEINDEEVQLLLKDNNSGWKVK